MNEGASVLDSTRDEVSAMMGQLEELPEGVVTLAREPKDINNEVAKALASLGLAILTLPPDPVEAEQVGGRKIIFFPKVKLTVRIVEKVTLNPVGMNATAARDVVMRDLQGWRPTHPGVASALALARNPQRKVEFPGKILIDVFFNYASHLWCSGQ